MLYNWLTLLNHLIYMGSKERILRQKAETRLSILDAAHAIVREAGWQGLNMRKIADRIEYTAPIIYEYFSKKEAILVELAKKGNMQLVHEVQAAQRSEDDPSERLHQMWAAFWAFAFAEKELYRVMFGVEMTCCLVRCESQDKLSRLFMTEIADIMKAQEPSELLVQQKFFTFFAVIHGLISINLVGNGLDQDGIQAIFDDAVYAIIQSLK